MVSLSIDPPPSSRQPRSSRGGGILVLLGIVAVAALGAGFWLGRATAPGGRFSSQPAPEVAAVPARTAPSAPARAAPAGSASPASPTAAATPIAGQAADAAAPAPAAPSPQPAGPRRIVVSLKGALEESIARALPPGERTSADQLTQVLNRLLVWNLHVARDGRPGDRIEIVYTPAQPVADGLAAPEPVIEAVRYASQKLGRTFSAYRFQPEGQRWAHYYREDGSELEERLVDAPIAEYEQITSLLRDGRKHKGIDFKTPVGTPVVSPVDGVIERRNWNFRGNGNCLDVRDAASGRHAIFLHLDVLPKDIQVGRRVKKGEQIAVSGNSGHSFAPHLHYQMESADGRVLDPFTIHKLERRSLSAAQKPAFDAARARLDGAVVAGANPVAIPAAGPVVPAPVPAVAR